MRINVEARDVYGVRRLYVIGEPAKSALRALTGKTTLDHTDCEALEMLGLVVVFPARDEARAVRRGGAP